MNNKADVTEAGKTMIKVDPNTNTIVDPKDLAPKAEEILIDLDLAHKVIKLAEGSGAAEVEVFMIKGTDTGFSIENNVVTFASSGTEFGMGIRVIKDKRLGFGYCTNLDGAKNAVKNALNFTKLAKQTEFSFVDKSNYSKINSIFDPSILELTIDEGLELTKQLIDSGLEEDPRVIVTGGGVGFGGGTVGLATSFGVEQEYSVTEIQCGVATLIKDKSISTGFEYESSRKNDLDLTKVGKTAADLAIKGQNPQKIEPGKYDIMLMPHAMAQLLEFTVIPALYGEPALKGESVYSNKLGENVANPDISLIDDGTMENGINTAPIDDEGTPSKRTVLIENGILKTFLFDRQSALEFDQTSTGNAVRAESLGSGRSYKTVPKTKALNITVEGRHGAKPRSPNTVMAELENGLMICDLLGAHTSNPASGDFSVNSPTLFKISGGDVARAGQQVMISGNMPELMKHIIALGNDFKDVGGGLTPIAQRIPSMVIEDVRII